MVLEDFKMATTKQILDLTYAFWRKCMNYIAKCDEYKR
jgi:hypothetical protein